MAYLTRLGYMLIAKHQVHEALRSYVGGMYELNIDTSVRGNHLYVMGEIVHPARYTVEFHYCEKTEYVNGKDLEGKDEIQIYGAHLSPSEAHDIQNMIGYAHGCLQALRQIYPSLEHEAGLSS